MRFASSATPRRECKLDYPGHPITISMWAGSSGKGRYVERDQGLYSDAESFVIGAASRRDDRVVFLAAADLFARWAGIETNPAGSEGRPCAPFAKSEIRWYEESGTPDNFHSAHSSGRRDGSAYGMELPGQGRHEHRSQRVEPFLRSRPPRAHPCLHGRVSEALLRGREATPPRRCRPAATTELGRASSVLRRGIRPERITAENSHYKNYSGSAACGAPRSTRFTGDTPYLSGPVELLRTDRGPSAAPLQPGPAVPPDKESRSHINTHGGVEPTFGGASGSRTHETESEKNHG